MNTQKMNTNTNTKTKNPKTVNNEKSWNNIKEIVKNRKQQKLQKKELFEEKFSNISKILKNKDLYSNSVPNDKTLIIKVPQNIESGQTFEAFIDGQNIKIKCPVNAETGKKISFKIKNTRNIYKEIQSLVNIRRTYKIMYEMGSYYGYPKCCINAFVLNTHNEHEIEPIQELAGRYSGYIPCVKCSKELVSNNLSIEKLIKDRKCNTKFPYDDEPGHVIPCKKHAQLIFLKKITMYQAIKSGCKDCYASDDDSDDELDRNECCSKCKI